MGRSQAFRRFVIIALLALIRPSLQTGEKDGIYQTAFDNVTWDNDNWVLTTTYPNQGHYQSRGNLANGYIGINVAALGPFFEVDSPVDGDDISGWPLFDRRQSFATIGGFYDVQKNTSGTNFAWLDFLGGESVISGIPHWAGLLITAGGSTLDAYTDPSQISDFSSSLSLKDAYLSWSYTWTPPQGPALCIEYGMFLHKLFVNQAAVSLQITAAQDTTVAVTDVLDGDCAVRSFTFGTGYESDSPTIWSAVQPDNIPYVTAYIYSTLGGATSVDLSSRSQGTDAMKMGGNSSSVSQEITINLKKDTPATIEKFVGIASTDAFGDPQGTAKNASLLGAQSCFAGEFKTHATEWHSIFTPDTIDNYTLPDGTLPTDGYTVEQQIFAVTNPFYLLENTVGQNAINAAGNNTKLDVNSIAVSGLSSDSYAGLIFWDSEVWMAPGLVVAHPEAARQIANYRVEKYDTARANIAEAYTSSQNMTSFSPDAAIYPWTGGGRFGNCSGVGPCFDYEYHINGDIALELENYFIVTADDALFESQFFPLYNSIAQVYSDLVYLNETAGTYMLRNATDPDEYANFVDNPGYTMALIKTTLDKANNFRSQFNMTRNDTWTTQANSMNIPVYPPAEIILEYTGMNGSISVKQADVVLIDDFLDYPNPYTLTDLDFYAGRQTLNGPGMTFGVFSIVASSAAPSGCSAYTYDLYGSVPYARAPWFQYSEQLIDDYTTNGGTHPAFPFLTGMGGALRVAVFGYLGLKLQQDSFNVNPSLPPQIAHLTYRTIYWQGHAIKAVSNATHTTLTRMPHLTLATANSTYAGKAPIPVTVAFDTQVHKLTTNAPIVLTNRQASTNLTVPGNLAQCMPATSNTTTQPGQFAISAIDGAVSTSWRPSFSNVTSTLTVTLGDAGIAPVSGFALDWAQSPPASFSVSFANASDASDATLAYTDNNVQVALPYIPADAAEIAQYQGNTTNVTLQKPVWGGRYALLSITGNRNDGANVNGSDAVGAGASVAEFAVVKAGTPGGVAMRRYYHT